MTQEEILSTMRTDPEKGMSTVTCLYTALVYKVVWGKLASVCTSEDIEETVSDVFLEFYRKHDSVDLSKGSLATFLITLAQRRAVDVFRSIKPFLFEFVTFPFFIVIDIDAPSSVLAK